MDTTESDHDAAESQVETPAPISLADLPDALAALCDATQSQLMQRVAQLRTRLEQCEQSLQRSADAHRVLLRTMRAESSAQQREIDDLESRTTTLQQHLRKEKHERREEKEWLTELWPDGVVLPTLLKPFEAQRLSDGVTSLDPAERKRLLACINRRVARERVAQQIEASRQWRAVVEPAATNAETGELEPERVYYLNIVTGESAWDAPLVMAYEPPPQWNTDKMDWKDSYGIEHFYDSSPGANAQGRASTSQTPGRLSKSNIAAASENAAPNTRAQRLSEADESTRGESDDEDGDSDDKDDDGDHKEGEGDTPADPIALREQMTAALEHHKKLQVELSASEAQQRALALQLLNASRESFEREAEALALEDEATRDAERKKRKALLQEQAAAKAKADALEKKQQQSSSGATTVYAKFSKDSVGKKDLTLAKDDAALEQELDAFVLKQRADRPYLTVPLSLEPRVKFHHQLDDEYVHMKSMETQILAIEQLEFDLLEKSALRHEEASAKADDLVALCDQVRTQQLEVAADLESVRRAIARLDVPLPPPTEARPSDDDLQRASVRFVTLKPLDDDDDDDDGGDGGRESGSGAVRTESERTAMATEVARENMTPEEVAALLQDEAELVLFKSFVDAEQHWRDWEREEAMRIDELAQATARQTLLERVQRQLALDLALAESDTPFFAQLGAFEKALNARLWAIQADSQTERVRFMIERAAREEAVFQMTDRLGELRVALEAAQRLPLQALNPIERLRLEDESRERCAAIAAQTAALQVAYDKEMAAKKLLIELEMRSSRYAHAKLEEEMALFREKQALWDLNFALADELQDARKTIERLFVLMQEEDGASTAGSDPPSTLLDSGAVSPLPTTAAPAISTARRERYALLQQQQDDATGVFDAKLQTQQHVRQFLLACYEREARWRGLTSIALIPDTSSHEWMTSMQRERHESMLAILQDQHTHETQQLQQQLSVLHQVKRKLLAQIDDLHTKLERVQSAYQASSNHVREQTERVIRTLTAEIAALQQTLRDEKSRAQAERERLVREHDAIRTALDARILELEAVNEQQRHWLTAAKHELHAQRIANEELVKAYASLEKRRAAETNDMRFRITAQIAKINNIEMWNLSLKLQARDAQRERIALQREMDALVAQHKQQQQLLRLRNWRQRVTAQAVLTHVDLLFRFFVDGLDVLAGATHDVNAALRTHGAIEVLAALAQHCHAQQAIRVVCARALGQLVWNANATPRALGWRAKRKWFAWVTAQSDAALAQLARNAESTTPTSAMLFDAVADEASTSMNWLADPSECAGESDFDDTVRRQHKKIRFVQTWHQLDELRFPDTNAHNQAHMALSPGVLQTLIDLCHAPPQRKLVRLSDDSSGGSEDDAATTATQIQRNALRSLALVVMDARNTAIIGRMDGCIAHLVGLTAPQEPPEDSHVVRHAVLALSNLAFGNASNQVAITTHGAVPHLLAFCADATDVDMIVAATQALAHLTHLAQAQVCEVLFDNGAIPILARLCHSPRIYDTVELDVYEQIQTSAAQVLASIVAALDADENESDYRARSVADAILEADSALLQSGDTRGVGGVASFVLMCASCNRDVAYHAAVVLGSIAQHDAIREAIGAAGGVDALFLLADRRGDSELVLQATWALANLTWNQDNQYRIARYMPTLFGLCSLSIREHALCVLANALFFNDANRQLVASQSKWIALLQHECVHGHGAALEHAARALCALSYSDAIALSMGIKPPTSSSRTGSAADALALSGLEVFVRLCGCAANPLVQRHGLYGVINLCLHDVNKSRILDVPHGIETLVNLSGATDKELCVPALEALELLADVRQLQSDGIASSRALASSTDVKKLIALLSDATSPALVAMVSDAIADEVWKTPSAKVKLRNEHGLEKLLQLCVQPLHEIVGSTAAHSVSLDDERKLRVSCLWALRNTVSDNVRNQDLVGALDGVEQLVLLSDRQRRHDDVVEAVLAALVALVLKHPLNSQQLVQFGLDMLLGLADGTRSDDDDSSERERTVLPPLGPGRASAASPHTPSRPASSPRRPGLQNAALARELLHLVAPYNALPAATASPSPDKRSTLRRLQQRHARADSSK